MKFLCVDCDAQMKSVESAAPGDGTMAITFRCPNCDRQVAMLTNPMETRMVDSLCVDLSDSAAEAQPFESVRSHLETRHPDPSGPDPVWSDEAEKRLGRVPGFVRGTVRKLYMEWARERGLSEITLTVMDEARAQLGIEEM
ncbi:MAG: hypothetical protein GWN99_14675 [Gemmatimonadetes bacterium]|uniref:Light-independent protochlorophyllide reductase subunit B-like C-terminal domain-containing protein n=1 Tax=Candidatus Kutchimonas denitrificans TaxID=3056748 RepID=A0AAE4ZBL1_9BACT|nr:hypothetical protein [Gemmatimonadota bacterium]NIR76267.1 hypothetical protein [Candidatus Kutchimonas denitrificans]NIS02290.1 hypothetical protein [Gemmatimonadota bacterium]NIT68109.1 hypothetical protein [Gemmatimonadota bacterium]NIU54333.1 hypothetical protein [Gemmatimonadota bacterium]